MRSIVAIFHGENENKSPIKDGVFYFLILLYEWNN